MTQFHDNRKKKITIDYTNLQQVGNVKPRADFFFFLKTEWINCIVNFWPNQSVNIGGPLVRYQ